MPAARAPRLDRRDAAALLFLAALSLALRLVALDANPSLELARGLLTDEGAWAHNARQAALFGRWIIDDHNPGLTIAPVYSAALRATYAWMGVDFVSTRLVGALSGVALGLATWLWVRLRVGRAPALVAGLWLAVGSFALVHERIAMVEPLQMLLLLACAGGVVRAADGGRGASAWAAMAAVALWLAVATKLTAVALAPAIALFWALQLVARGRSAVLPPFAWRPVLVFAATSLAGLAVVAAVAHASPEIWSELVGNLRSATSGRQRETLVLSLPGFARLGLPAPSLPYGSFLRLCAPMLALAVALAATRIADAAPAPRERATTSLEVFCACWIAAVAGFVAVQAYQPDRRFLAALPALAIYGALAVRPGALALPARGDASRLRLAAAGALVGGFAGLYAHLLLGSGGAPTASAMASRALAVSLVAGGAGGALLWSALPARRRAAPRAAVAAIVVAMLGVELARFAREAASFEFGVRDTSRALAALTDDWDERDRVLVGAEAYTYALETRLFAFTIRLDRPAGIPQNPNGWEAFDPRLMMVYGPANESEARAHGLVPWRAFRPRRFVVRGEVVEPVVWVFAKPQLCPECDTSGALVFAPDQGA
ncbi:MAG: glycosyltransferase family 39 protein [Myxococcota bacterium]